METELKAEYERHTVLWWHVVPVGDSNALCGRLLAPTAETRPLPTVPDGEVCPLCMAVVRGAVADPEAA